MPATKGTLVWIYGTLIHTVSIVCNCVGCACANVLIHTTVETTVETIRYKISPQLMSIS